MSDVIIDFEGNNGLAFGNHFAKTIKDLFNATYKLNLSDENASEEMEKNYPSFITGLMVLKGKRDIVMTLTFSKMAAAKLMVTLLGLPYDKLVDVEVYDAMMEVTNMASGRLKSLIVTSGEHYQLTTPFVFVGQNHFISAQTRPIGIVKKFKDKQFEMLAAIYYL